MRFKSRLCLFVLCAFALLLGLVTAGCSSQDREGSKKTATTKTITYSYTKSDAPSVLKGVPSTAKFIYVAAYDASGKKLSAELQNNEDHDAWAGYDETSQTYNAVTVADINTDYMLYTFTYQDEESGSEVEVYTDMVSNVTDIKDGGSTQSSDEVEFTCKFYGSDGEELPAGKVTVDDQFSVRVFAQVNTTEQDISAQLDSLTFAPAELLEEGTAWTYTAKSEGTVQFSAEIEEVKYQDIGSITIVPKEIPGEPALYLCPAGWSVNASGQLLNDKQEVVEDATAIPTDVDIQVGATYTFVPAYKSAEGTFTDVSAEASLDVDTEGYEGTVTVTGMNLSVDKTGKITVTATYGELKSTNNLICNLSFETAYYLCPAGYSVVEGKLYDDAETPEEVTDPDTLKDKEISGVYAQDNLGNTPYTFVLVLRQEDGSYIDVSNSATLSADPSDGISFDGCQMNPGTMEEMGTGEHTVSAQEGETKAANQLKFTPAAYTYSSYICPPDYYVTGNRLKDPNGNVVELKDIPTRWTLTVGGKKYTFASAILNRDDEIVDGNSYLQVESSDTDVVLTTQESMEVTTGDLSQASSGCELSVSSTKISLTAANKINTNVVHPNFYICPEGYSIDNQGRLLDSKSAIVTSPSSIENTAYITPGASCTFLLALYNSSNKTWSEYDITDTGYSTIVYNGYDSEIFSHSETSGTVLMPSKNLNYYSVYIGLLKDGSPVSMNDWLYLAEKE